MNFGMQTPKNRIEVFAHPPQILHCASLAVFADGGQQTELNQTLLNGWSTWG